MTSTSRAFKQVQGWDRWEPAPPGCPWLTPSPPAPGNAAPAREAGQLLSEMLGELWKAKTNVCLQCMSRLLLLSSAPCPGVPRAAGVTMVVQFIKMRRSFFQARGAGPCCHRHMLQWLNKSSCWGGREVGNKQCEGTGLAGLLWPLQTVRIQPCVELGMLGSWARGCRAAESPYGG